MDEDFNPKQVESAADGAYLNGEFLKAAHFYKTAMKSFEAQGDEIRAAEMANNCSVALLKAGEANDALLVLEGTSKIFEDVGDVRHQAMAFGNRGAALDALKESEAAMDAYQNAADLFASLRQITAKLLSMYFAMKRRSVNEDKFKNAC